MKSFLPNDIKDQNRKLIFDILLQEPELAKVEITERTTMSFVTVSKIVDFFEQIGIVAMNGESREGSGGLGRKRVVYSFNPNSYVTIGIQVIGNTVSAVLVNLYSEVIASYDTNTKVTFYEEYMFQVLENIVTHFQKIAEQFHSVIVGVGIGVDGAINERDKTIRMRTSNNQEEDYAYETILEKLEQQIDLPVILENDVNASAIAAFSELDRGGEGPEDLLQIALGEGIGAGLILDKKLHRGHNAGVGELEYMCFDTEYVRSPSSVGWLENKLNLEYLREVYHYMPEMTDMMDKGEIEESVTYISKYLALAITNIVSLLDMRTVILSGKTVLAFPEEILEKTKKYINKYTGWDLDISVGKKSDLTAVGAAILTLQSEMTKVIAGERGKITE